MRPIAATAKLILAKVGQNKLDPVFTARDVYRPQWSGLVDKVVISDALEMLVDHGWLTSFEEAAQGSGGRPTTAYAFYLAKPTGAKSVAS